MANGAASGAASGAAAGAVAGPWGAVIGAGIGAIAGATSENDAENKSDEARKRAEFGGKIPKRRRLKRMTNQIEKGLNNKQRALIAMAQAHQNAANMY